MNKETEIETVEKDIVIDELYSNSPVPVSITP